MLTIDLSLIWRLTKSLVDIPHGTRQGLKGALIRGGINKLKIWNGIV